MTRIETMQQARGTAADLVAVNPVLLDGQIVVEQGTGRFKIGDGVRAWTALPYGAPTLPTLAAVATTGSYADLSGTPADLSAAVAALSATVATQAAQIAALQAAISTPAPDGGNATAAPTSTYDGGTSAPATPTTTLDGGTAA